MLAKTFKSAAELGIPEHEVHALTTVLFMLEDGEIKPELINMTAWTTLTFCGTAHCLAGWAHEVDRKAFPELSRSGDSPLPIAIRLRNRVPPELAKLFAINDDVRVMYCASPAQATAALRHYLETGNCGIE